MDQAGPGDALLLFRTRDAVGVWAEEHQGADAGVSNGIASA